MACTNADHIVKLYTVFIFMYSHNKFKKKSDPYFGIGKKSKVMPQSPAIYLFPWEREGNLQSLI